MTQDVIAGSEVEEKVVEKLKRKFSENADWIDFLKTPVTTWTPRECTLTIGDSEVNCTPLPYSLGGEVEDYLTFNNTCPSGSGGILLLEYPENYYSTGYKVLKAYEEGASAVILLDRDRSITRKIVVTNPPHLLVSHGVPLPIPVVTLDFQDYQRLVRELEKGQCKRAMLRVKAELKKSFGYTVQAGFNGQGEAELHVASHHDHWFDGVGDSLVGVKTLELLSSMLSKTRERPNVVLISFTAKELGSPSLRPYHWSWGSEYFLEVMSNKSRLENVVFSILIDAVHRHDPLIYYHPSLQKLVLASLPSAWEAIPGGNHYSFDSLMYLRSGIPAILITTLHRDFSWRIHYSSLDNFANVQVNAIVDNILNFVWRTMARSLSLEIGAQGLFEYLMREDLSSEYRSFIAKSRQACKVIGENEVLKSLTKVLTEYGSLSINEHFYHYGGLIGTGLLTKRAERFVGELVKKEGCRVRVMLHRDDGTSYDLFLTSVNKSFVEAFLSNVIRETVKKYEEAFKLDYTFKVLNTSHNQGGVDGERESSRS